MRPVIATHARARRTGRVAVVLGCALGVLVGCQTGEWPERATASSLPLTDEPRIHVLVEEKRAPTDPSRVPVSFQPGYALTDDGEIVLDDSPWAKRRGRTIEIARIEIGRTDPDHAGAVQELRRIAADLGAEALMDVGYTLCIDEDYPGGSLVYGWIYHGRAVVSRRAPGAEPGSEEGQVP